MRDYSKVTSAFWTGATGRALRGDPQAQLLALYLLTSPHANMIGVYYCPIAYMAHEIGSTTEGASEALLRLEKVGFCTFDQVSEVVFVHRMAAFQIDRELKPNDKRVLGVVKDWESIAQPRIKARFYEIYAEAFHLPAYPGKVKPLASPLQAPPKPGTGAGAGVNTSTAVDVAKTDAAASVVDLMPPDTADAGGGCPHREIIAAYHELLPMCPRIRDWTPARATALRTRWREKPERQSIDWWRQLFAYCAKSDFLTGRSTPSAGRKPFVLSLDWLVKAENFAKVREGKYENEREEAVA